MTRSQSLEAALLANGTITALVSDRIYPLVAAKPYGATVLVYKIAVRYDDVLGGVEKINAALEMRSWSKDYDVAHALADAVQSVLMPVGSAKGFSGHLGGSGGINVIYCRLKDEDENVVEIGPDQYIFEVVSLYDLKYIL